MGSRERERDYDKVRLFLDKVQTSLILDRVQLFAMRLESKKAKR